MRTKETIFIVDDSMAEALITRRVLSRIAPDSTTVIVSSGEAAIDLLRKSIALPALVLLDLKMLGLSGLDIIRLVRADNRLKHILIIVVSNSALEKDRADAMLAGADSFLHKDYDITVFENNMRYLMEKHLT
jgi:CheY-like chemotaxis protein